MCSSGGLRCGAIASFRASSPIDSWSGSRAASSTASGRSSFAGRTTARRRGSLRWWSERGGSRASPSGRWSATTRRARCVELKRNLRILSAMSTLGPLLGLLGTVVGIIQSFDALGGRIGPARGEMLAHGISLALVATAFGLSIAIVAVTFYYYFLNRVDVLIRELDDRTRQVIELVSSESQRMIGADRRHVPLGAGETHRHESRVI